MFDDIFCLNCESNRNMNLSLISIFETLSLEFEFWQDA